MKKIIFLFFMCFMLCSCSLIKKEEVKKENKTKVKEEAKDEYVDNNPIIIGLYSKSGSNINLVKSYTNNFISNKDILNFQSYASNEELIKYKGNFKDTWLPIWDSYENNDNYKIGYIIEYTLISKENIYHQILSPDDMYEYFDYIQVYLYDALYHSSSSWYSHVTKEEYNDSTVLTSIKLTGGANIDQVLTPIKLTTFTYDSDDFDESGKYRGISKYTIEINRK